MSINTIRFEHDRHIRWGVVRDGAVTPIPGEFPTTGDFVSAADPVELARLEGDTIPESEVTLLAPITRNQRFVCQGANYRQHMIESGLNPDDKTFNMIFTKASSCIVPATADVLRPKISRLLDYEVELGIVIRKAIDGPVTVTRNNLHELVAGILIVNDVTARDIQIPQMQFYKGKSFRTFGPCGPYLCLLEPKDIHYLDELELQLRVNGEVRQNDTSANLVFKPAETLTELSSVHDFAPGDLLSTGTPAGCALSAPGPAKQKVAGLLPDKVKWNLFLKMQAARPQYLKPGDRMETTIRSADGVIDLGTQRNLIRVEGSE